MRVEIKNLTKKYGSITAVDNVNITAEAGELTTLVGPSGCGKTTTLRSIAGLERPDSGQIKIGDEIVTDPQENIFVPTQDRNVGFVFQTFDIWSHMSVFENVAFPLEIRDYSEDQIEEKVTDILELANIGELRDKNATDLSGGQQARVGICRALVYEPKVLLCDEPLTGLDRNLRTQMRYEIRRIVSELGITTVYVTHSQPEAMAISDKICLMNTNGEVEQIGRSEDIYTNPVSKYSFDFFGTSQFFEGRVTDSNRVETEIGTITHNGTQNGASEKVVIGFRPEEIEMSSEKRPDWTQNVFEGRINAYSFLGETHEFGISINDEIILARQSRLIEDLQEGDNVFLHLDSKKVHVFTEANA